MVPFLEALLVFLQKVILLFVLTTARVLVRVTADHGALLRVALRWFLRLLWRLLSTQTWLLCWLFLFEVTHFKRLNHVLLGFFVAHFRNDLLNL